jgi:hypothetical protein
VLLDRLERTRAAVRGGGAADADDHDLGAGVYRRADQLARAVRGGGPRVARVLGDEAEPGGGRHLEHGGAAVLDQRERRVHGVAERPAHARGVRLAAERQHQRLHRPLATVRERAQIRREQPGALQPAADRCRHLRGAERPLERIGGDEDGALGNGRHGPYPGATIE